MQQVARKLTENILFSLNNSPIVLVNGPRQAGKSSLVRKLAQKQFPAEYVSFDNATQMAAAAAEPNSFLANRQGAMIIDEVQLVPEIFRELKIVVDEIRFQDKANSNGRFLLTGSANIMALPKLSDPLVGRVSVKALYPFAVCEVLNTKGNFIDNLFIKKFSDNKNNHLNLNDAIAMATFPEVSQSQPRQRSDWFEGYLSTILQRDVRVLSELEKIAMLPTLLQILAHRAGSLINDAAIARDINLNPVTSRSYRNILQAMFLTFNVQPWYRNIGKRLVKSPKGYIGDTLMLSHLLDLNLEDVRNKKPQLYGHIVENFVATELLKLLTFSDIRAKLFHFRTSDNKEVDFVLEQPNGSIAAIEIKTAENVSAKDFNGIKELQANTADDFICGIVLYSGKQIVPFAKDLFAVPFAALWQ